MNNRQFVRDGLLGLAVGDALGVPAEFRSRGHLQRFPITGMTGYGSHNMPPGTWSDDTSLTCCLAEALIHGINTNEMAANFIRWRYENWWTPRGSVFDIGIATSEAIYRLRSGTPPELAGGWEEDDNGNGSLMRILPLVFLMHDMPEDERFEVTKKVSALTHGHMRSVIGCYYFLEFVRLLMTGEDKFAILKILGKSIPKMLAQRSVISEEINIYHRLFDGSLQHASASEINSSGYVVHTLEASVWCLLTTGSYQDAVLQAVNLGEDTDTTGAVTGALAGILYGEQSIPQNWLDQLVKREEIEALANRLQQSLLLREREG